MMRWYHVFFVALVVTLAVQTWIWRVDTLTDESLWVERMQHMRADLHDGSFQQKDYSSHPATTVLLLAAGMRSLGFSDTASVEASVAVLVSIAIAGVALVTYILIPNSWWWIGASGLLMFHPLFTGASPPSAVLGPWIVLVFLSCSFFLDQEHPLPRWAVSLLAVAAGVASATRLEMTLLFCVPVFAWLLLRERRRQAALALVGAFIIFIVLDPLMATQPFTHLSYIAGRVELHALELGVAQLSPPDFFLYSPLALMSLLIGAYGALRRNAPAWQRESLCVAVISTVAASAALLYAQTQSVRYFFPLIMFWEAMLPLWLLKLATRTRYVTVASVSVLGLLIAGQAFLLIQALY